MQTRHIEAPELQLDESQYLGIGTYGLVKRGVWRSKHVAVKYLRQVRDKQSFLRELRQLCNCDHENIVKIFGANKEENFFVMEFADCGTLCKVMHSTHEVHYTISHVVKWAVQLGMAVAYLHSQKPRPIVHRDLKPLNLLLFQAGRVLKLCDFGTARTADSFMSNLKGTCLWMAPEVCGPKDTSGPLARYSEKCDIFSWGIILWEMLARKRPYSADFEMRDTIKIMLHVVLEQGRPRPLIGCPPELNDLITSCWAQSPEERPSMDDCVRLLSLLIPHLPGYDDPLDMPGIPHHQDTEPSVTEEPPLATVSRQDTEGEDDEEEVVEETGDDQTQKEGEEEGKPSQELSRSWEVVGIQRVVTENVSDTHLGAQKSKKNDRGLKSGCQRSQEWEIVDREELSPFQLEVVVHPELQAMKPVPGNSLSRSVYESHLDLLRRYEGLMQDIAIEEQKKHDVDRKLRESCNDNEEWMRMEEYMNMMLQIEEINNSQAACGIANGLR